MAAPDWSRAEVELVVADYLEMLAAQFAGQKVSKSERRRALQAKLNARNDSSVERKRSNISAVVEKLGFHYLSGYKPLPNYQRLLDSVVAEQIANAPWLDEAAIAAVQLPAVATWPSDFAKVKTDAPRLAARLREPTPSFRAVRRDYIEREARNRSLGKAGEEFVVAYERWRLTLLGHHNLAQRVEWVSTVRGDGLGYDIHSYEGDGTDKHIEVKTTAFGVATPFFISDIELKFARSTRHSFHVYRLFQFRQEPKLFTLSGDPGEHCILDPVTFRASFS